MSTQPKPKNIVPNPLTITPAKFLRLEARLLGRRKQRPVPKAKPVPPATRAKRFAISRPPIFKPALAIAMQSGEYAWAANSASSAAPAAVDEAREALRGLDTPDLEQFLVRDFQREIEDQRAEIAEMEAS